jgi:prophage antirepressor-like protein
MNNISVFNNEEFGSVGVFIENGELWFVGKDVAEALGYVNTRDALSKHVDSGDKADVAIYDGRQNQEMQFQDT